MRVLHESPALFAMKTWDEGWLRQCMKRPPSTGTLGDRSLPWNAFQGREVSPKVPVGAGSVGHEGFSWLTCVVRDENVV
jgi:hypothetical protein